MAVVKCKVEWESDGWSYIVLQGSQLRYTKVPSSIIVKRDEDSYIFVEQTMEYKQTYRSLLKDVRYPEYDFIRFNIKKDQFVEDEQLEMDCKTLYKLWCRESYEQKIEELDYL